MESSFAFLAAKMLFFLAFLGVLPGSMKNQTFETNYLTVDTGKLEAPVRIAMISDLHMHEYGPDNADLIAAVQSQSPDLIAIVGDMVIQDKDEYGSVLTLCRKLTEIAPVYYVYGNHEYGIIHRLKSRIGEELKAIGVNVLDSEFRTIEVNGNLIDIAGIPRKPVIYNWSDQMMMNSFIKSPNFHLLLVHDPGYFDPHITTNPDKTLIGKPIDVALCGHRHGGQIQLPMVGGLFHTDTGFFPGLTAGDTVVSGTHVIVSRGLNDHNHIPRLNNPYELLIIDLN